MAFQEKQIAQIRPTVTTPIQAYSPAVGVTGIIKFFTVANTSNGARRFSIYLDDDGTTFDEDTALFFEISLARQSTFLLSVWWPMNNPVGNLAVQTSAANDLTFTFHGAEVSV